MLIKATLTADITEAYDSLKTFPKFFKALTEKEFLLVSASVAPYDGPDTIWLALLVITVKRPQQCPCPMTNRYVFSYGFVDDSTAQRAWKRIQDSTKVGATQ